MNKDIVIIPVFNRPEYLLVCLQLLKANLEAKEHLFLFACDSGHDKNNERVIEAEMKGFDYKVIFNNGNKYREMKQSYNLLKAYEFALTLTDGLIYMVEDDIFCSVSFFKTHRKIHTCEPDIFCVTANFLNNDKKLQTMNLETYQTSDKSIYQSLGVSFKANIIRDYILPHINTMYFISPSKYIKQYFAKHWLSSTYSEQDGLIRRIADLSKLGIAFPDYPRCYHAGIYGYHRVMPKIHKKTLQEKLSFIIETCFDVEKMEQFNQFDDVFVSDININNNILCQKTN